MILTTCQAANILRINENTLNALAFNGQIPHTRIPSSGGGQLRFNTADIKGWLRQGPELNTQDSTAYYQKQFQKQFPDALANLHKFDSQFIKPPKGKGYSLSKVKNNKLGFIYYVRYIENGRLVPTRRSTHTNNEEEAHAFAAYNRKRILSEYYQRKAQGKTSGKMYYVMRKYYDINSPYLKKDILRGRTLGEQGRHAYYNSIHNHWIPFLKKSNIKKIEEIDTPLMARYQDYCLAKGLRPQSVNHNVSFTSNIFDHLLLRGDIKFNPCTGLQALQVKEKDKKIRGCYCINELKGIFNKRWDNELHYLLCLVIYFTGMRNSEIDRIQIKDIFTKNKYRFIHIPKSKTRYGERIVPLHNFVYGKLKRYIDKNKKEPEDVLFCHADGKKLPRRQYTDANITLGTFIRHDRNKELDREAVKKKLKEENITFYSGRHFWKTLMNAHGLGEVEEYFMGHKVSNDVAKRYNHRDKQGQEKIAQKAREVFKILDGRLFNSGASIK
jgi:excisionase family DNA binding protein